MRKPVLAVLVMAVVAVLSILSVDAREVFPRQSEWAYVRERPADAWQAADYDDGKWARGKGGFGVDVPQLPTGTVWLAPELWLRRHFTFDGLGANEYAVFDMFHDENAEVFVNGVKVFEIGGYNTGYESFAVSREKFAAAVRKGDNVIAVHVTQTAGGQFFDMSLQVERQAEGDPFVSGSGRWVSNLTLVGRRYHPESVFSYTAWVPEDVGPDAAVYLLLEFNPGRMQPIIGRLMAEGKVPPGIVVWTGPGGLRSSVPGFAGRWMRASEFDQPGTDFPNFLVEELVLAAAQTLGVKVSASPELHFITGMSSGGHCAWNAAWFRNDYFRRVFLSSPTFSAMRGGEEAMTIVRKSETRPMRIFMTCGTVEPDSFFGDSYYVALNAAGAFKYAGYDYQFRTFAHEGHCARVDNAELWNEMLPWLFRGWKDGAKAEAGNPLRVTRLIGSDSQWTACDFKMPRPVRETLSTDRARRYRVAPDSRFVMADTLAPDGSDTGSYILSNLHVAWNARCVGGRALALLQDDRVLVATDLGVQGVVSFGLTDVILPLPGDLPVENITVVGKTLYAASGKRVFRRPLEVPAADPTRQVAPSTPGYGDGFDYSHEHLP